MRSMLRKEENSSLTIIDKNFGNVLKKKFNQKKIRKKCSNSWKKTLRSKTIKHQNNYQKMEINYHQKNMLVNEIKKN